jgi:DNA-binding NarL/FixJ family response regulator
MERANAPAERRLEIVVADPDPLTRSVLAGMIEAVHLAAIRCVADADHLLDLVEDHRPDVVVANEGILAPDRFAALREIHQLPLQVSVIMVTNGPEATAPLDALRAGVDAIIPKTSTPEEIGEAIRSVLTGRAVVRPRVAMALILQLRRTPASVRGFRPIHSDLTNREWEILDLLVAGASTKQIADELVLSQDTVYTHIKNILRKMHVRSRAEAVQAAKRLYRLRSSAGTTDRSPARHPDAARIP